MPTLATPSQARSFYQENRIMLLLVEVVACPFSSKEMLLITALPSLTAYLIATELCGVEGSLLSFKIQHSTTLLPSFPRTCSTIVFTLMIDSMKGQEVEEQESGTSFSTRHCLTATRLCFMTVYLIAIVPTTAVACHSTLPDSHW